MCFVLCRGVRVFACSNAIRARGRVELKRVVFAAADSVLAA